MGSCRAETVCLCVFSFIQATYYDHGDGFSLWSPFHVLHKSLCECVMCKKVRHMSPQDKWIDKWTRLIKILYSPSLTQSEAENRFLWSSVHWSIRYFSCKVYILVVLEDSLWSVQKWKYWRFVMCAAKGICLLDFDWTKGNLKICPLWNMNAFSLFHDTVLVNRKFGLHCACRP